MPNAVVGLGREYVSAVVTKTPFTGELNEPGGDSVYTKVCEVLHPTECVEQLGHSMNPDVSALGAPPVEDAGVELVYDQVARRRQLIILRSCHGWESRSSHDSVTVDNRAVEFELASHGSLLRLWCRLQSR